MDPWQNTQDLSLRPEVRAYWQSLGRFVTEFASLESAMQLALWHYANVSPNIGRAVFSGVRADAAMGLIKRISEVEKWEKSKKDTTDELFVHLASINSVRNDLIHFGVQPVGDGSWQITNAFLALTEGRMKKHPISDKILDQMTHDLRKIIYSLFLLVVDAASAQNLLATFQQQADAPWQYKPAQQSNSPGKSLKNSRARQRRHQPSRA
ncbi:MAG TPA: hypothetical protein VGR52_04210 [Stellaceae bacterium]|nr:hypothetical protein [Stellaceae bacterium]